MSSSSIKGFARDFTGLGDFPNTRMEALRVVKHACVPEYYKAEEDKPTSTPKPAEGTTKVAYVPLHQRNWVRTLLTFYNGFLAMGWGYITIAILSGIYREGWEVALSNAFENYHRQILFLQAVLLIDILNLLLGFVPPPAFGFFHTVSCKVLRRNHIFVASLLFVPEIHSSVFVGLMFLQWGFFDVIRYPFYVR